MDPQRYKRNRSTDDEKAQGSPNKKIKTKSPKKSPSKSSTKSPKKKKAGSTSDSDDGFGSQSSQSQSSQRDQDSFFDKNKVQLVFPELNSTEIFTLCRKDGFHGVRRPLLSWGEEGGRLLEVPRLEDQVMTWLTAAGINDELWNHLHSYTNSRRERRFHQQKIPNSVLNQQGRGTSNNLK